MRSNYFALYKVYFGRKAANKVRNFTAAYSMSRNVSLTSDTMRRKKKNVN